MMNRGGCNGSSVIHLNVIVLYSSVIQTYVFTCLNYIAMYYEY